MKKILLTLGALLIFAPATMAQDPVLDDDQISDDVKLEVLTPAEPVKETKKEIKEREKRIRELNDDVAFAKASNSLRRGYFVLIADYIQLGRMGYRHYGINPNSNFVLVQGEDGIIQYALNIAASGPNGIGGWTGRGTVRNKRISYADNGDVYLQYQMVSGKVNATVHITLYHNNNYALARITGGYDITIYGRILPYRDNDHR